MKNGDIISFWTTTGNPVNFPDRMQVWLNPTNNSIMLAELQQKLATLQLNFLILILASLPAHILMVIQHTWTKFEISYIRFAKWNDSLKNIVLVSDIM